MENKEVLEQRYNTYYEDYKVYNEYAVKIAEKVKKDREDFNKFASENQDNPQKLVDRLFEINEKQMLHLSDLASLKGRLKIATELLLDVIDIPEEIQKEVAKFPSLEFLYKPNNGDMVAIDEEKIATVQKQWQEMYKEQIKKLASNV